METFNVSGLCTSLTSCQINRDASEEGSSNCNIQFCVVKFLKNSSQEEEQKIQKIGVERPDPRKFSIKSQLFKFENSSKEKLIKISKKKSIRKITQLHLNFSHSQKFTFQINFSIKTRKNSQQKYESEILISTI